MDITTQIVIDAGLKAWESLQANWPYLVISIVIASALKTYANQERIAAFLQRYRRGGILTATAAAVGTPLCSCGTTALVLGMMASTMPWAPIVAFMAASPLTSPQELVYSAGLFGWPFALTYFAASIAIGIGGGIAAEILESRGFLARQARFVQKCCSGRTAARTQPGTPKQLFTEIYRTGARLLPLFAGFAFLGYALNGFIPSDWVSAVFGSGNRFSVPIAATLGLPLYLNSEGSLPLIKSFMDAGMTPGAALAFLITGAGTSIGAVAGALTIARWRVIALVVGVLWVGAILFGLGFDMLAAG
jgi:uncharacterized membrane protein YraQ (UPF0718 family)